MITFLTYFVFAQNVLLQFLICMQSAICKNFIVNVLCYRVNITVMEIFIRIKETIRGIFIHCTLDSTYSCVRTIHQTPVSSDNWLSTRGAHGLQKIWKMDNSCKFCIIVVAVFITLGTTQRVMFFTKRLFFYYKHACQL